MADVWNGASTRRFLSVKAGGYMTAISVMSRFMIRLCPTIRLAMEIPAGNACAVFLALLEFRGGNSGKK